MRLLYQAALFLHNASCLSFPFLQVLYFSYFIVCGIAAESVTYKEKKNQLLGCSQIHRARRAGTYYYDSKTFASCIHKPRSCRIKLAVTRCQYAMYNIITKKPVVMRPRVGSAKANFPSTCRTKNKTRCKRDETETGRSVLERRAEQQRDEREREIEMAKRCFVRV